MILVIGEVLFDVFPDYKRIGGAPFNFAYHVNSMNCSTRLITKIGMDSEGKLARKHLAPFPNNVRDTQIDEIHPTGKVLVELNEQGDPSYNILTDVAYDFIEFDDNLSNILADKPELIYFGSLIQRSDHGFRTVQTILENRAPESKCLYDINLRPSCYSEKIILSSLEHTDILKLNQGELRTLQEILRFDGSEPDFIVYLMDKYHLSMISLTRGADGSSLITPNGVFDTPGPDNITVVDTVGAGDAYSSIIAAGFLGDWQPNKILELATQFSAAVCGLQGAIPEDPTFYTKFIKTINGN